MTDAEQALFNRRTDELISIITDTIESRGSNVAADPIVVGQRILMRAIPFVEPLARNGPARREMLVRLLSAAEGRATDERLRLALGAVQQAMRMGLDSILVEALQNTEMLAQGARGCGACLLSLFHSYFRRHSQPAAPAAAGEPAPVANAAPIQNPSAI